MNKIASLPKIALLLPLLLGSHAIQASSYYMDEKEPLSSSEEFEEKRALSCKKVMSSLKLARRMPYRTEKKWTFICTAFGTLIALITALGWGNKILKLRIATKDGKKAGYGKRLGYATLFLLPLMPLMVFLGTLGSEIDRIMNTNTRAEYVATIPFTLLGIGIALVMIIWNIVLMATRGRTLFEHATKTQVIDVKKSTFNEDGSAQTIVKARWGKRIGAATLSVLFGFLVIVVPTLCCCVCSLKIINELTSGCRGGDY